MSEKEYEFTEDQNRVLDQLYKRLNNFTIIFIISGCLVLVVAAQMVTGPEGMKALPAFGVSFVIIALGVLFRRPLINIKNIIETEGRDISELMIAVKDFSQAFLSGVIISSIFLLVIIWRIIAVYSG